jgi:hypothetical protein
MRDALAERVVDHYADKSYVLQGLPKFRPRAENNVEVWANERGRQPRERMTLARSPDRLLTSRMQRGQHTWDL